MTTKKSKAVKRQVNEYAAFVAEVKERIRSTQTKVLRTTNAALIELYWHIGKGIVERQERLGWGKSVVEKLSVDLRTEFPDQGGFSAQNLWFMRQFYSELRTQSNLLRLVRELPWGHLITILSKTKEAKERAYYVRAATSYGWSRAVLTHQMETDLYTREVLAKKTHNFKRLLPRKDAKLAAAFLKEPYVLDFAPVPANVGERQLQRTLVRHLKQFLLELGKGYAFVGEEHALTVGTKSYAVDLLFYNFILRRFIAIDLKRLDFKPEYTGKMNFYLSAVDAQLCRNEDNQSVGIVLCKDKDDLVVEFALRDIHKPMGVATYRTTSGLPKQLVRVLPSVQELKRQLQTKRI